MPSLSVKQRAALFALGHLLLILWCDVLWPQVKLNASVLSLLPQGQSALSEEAQDQFLQRLDKQTVFLAAGDAGKADAFALDLQNSGLFAEVKGRFDEEFTKGYGQDLFEHSTAFLDDALRQSLQDGGTKRAQEVLAELYSGFMGVGSSELTSDPLLLIRDFQKKQLARHHSSLTLKNGYLCASQDGKDYYFIRAELKNSPFSLKDNDKTVATLLDIIQSHEARGTEILCRGTVFYSQRAASLAASDVQILGSCTVILVFALIFAVFRSILPVLLVMLSCLCGAVFALSAVATAFDEVHVMTLVLSVSIVGISVDYSLYYLTMRLSYGNKESPEETLSKIKPPLWWALLSTVCAYAALCAAPFGAIRQMAVFAMSGLIGAFLSVLCLQPFLCKSLKPKPLPCAKALSKWLELVQKSPRALILCALIAVLGVLAARASYHDDIQSFQEMPADLKAMDDKIAALTSQSSDQKWLAVHAESAEELLNKVSLNRRILNEAVKQELIAGYESIYLNPLSVQKSDLKLINQALPAVKNTLSSLGLELADNPYPQELFSLEEYLQSPLSEGYRLLYLHSGDEHCFLMPLFALKDTQALRVILEKEGTDAAVIDRKADFDALFETLRENLSWMFAAAMLAILVLFALRFGIKRAVWLMGPALCSTLCALAVPGLFHDLNFFNMLALLPVLGMGVNYTFFFASSQRLEPPVALATTLAMLTSLLTLGILVFSHTQAVSAFGLSLCCGLFAALLTAPLAFKGDILAKNN